jgi:hypothetical protein
VLGGPQTGKRTLLARLQGSDPYASENQQERQLASSVTIPYQPPDKKRCWDRILLEVQAKKTARQQKADFAILLIDPKHELEKTRSHLIKTLSTILSQLGYHPQQKEQQLKEKEKEVKADPLSQEPVCLCILFNFRDFQRLQPQQKEELQRLVQQITYVHYQVPQHKVVLQFAETSLRNCYGLNALHHFIYKTYLQRKETDLERQLYQVQTQIDTTEDLPPVMTYNDFVKVLETEGNEGKTPIPRPTKKDTTVPPSIQESPQTRSSKPPTSQIRKSAKPARTIPPPQQAAPAPRGRPAPRRTFVTDKKQPAAAPRIGKNALEAFLASSSDEEEENNPKHKSKTLPPVDSSDDEDDDDDFFYDESGNRRFNHQTHRNQSLTATTDSTSSNDSTTSSEESTTQTNQQPVQEATLKKDGKESKPLSPATKSDTPSNETKSSSPVVTKGSSSSILPVKSKSSEDVPPKDDEKHRQKDTSKAAASPEDATEPMPDTKANDSVDNHDNHDSQHLLQPNNDSDQSVKKTLSPSSAADDKKNEPQAAATSRQPTDDGDKDGWSDDDDDDDYVSDSTPEAEAEQSDDIEKVHVLPATISSFDKEENTKSSNNVDEQLKAQQANENDGFFVGEGGGSPGMMITSVDSDHDSWDDESSPAPAPPSSTIPSPTPTTTTTSPSPSSAISAAALAAIAAAQKEAEAVLLLQDLHASLQVIPEDDEKKQKKKKKHKEDKKKKKKHKD